MGKTYKRNDSHSNKNQNNSDLKKKRRFNENKKKQRAIKRNILVIEPA